MHLPRLIGVAIFLALLVVSGCAPSAVQAERPAFDGKRAFADLEKQVSFGPRVPGTPGHLQCRDWLMGDEGSVLIHNGIVVRFNYLGIAPTDLKLLTALLVVVALSIPTVRRKVVRA